MVYDEIKAIELQRLRELQKNAALHGPNTEPHILIEIQELLHKYPEVRREDRRLLLSQLDYDFLMNTVAAALKRLTDLEAKADKDAQDRITRQFIMNLWMIAITIISFTALILMLVQAK